ncbi:MAG: bifunctional riboflavin kinase/FAD synthetase [Chloroflexi bacterium]|nr:bifunctional riboflavin kinase/FAD synthetase [Chloroflexota bacterium]
MNKKVVPVEEELKQFTPTNNMLLSIGVFDGVHTGHRYLIAQLMALAKQQGLLSGVVTFRPHPRKILAPSTLLPYLIGLEERVTLLKNEGVDAVVVLSFTPQLARLTAREFVSLLQKHLRMRGIVVGRDFALGRNREGNVDALKWLGQEMDFTVTVIPPKLDDGEIVSSTIIRQAIVSGQIARANRLLGRPFSLRGRVVRGEGRGGPQLGFPTINLEVDPNQALPSDGVYATRTRIGGMTFQSMTNIGKRPTFGEKERTIETYILDFEGDMYGQEGKIDFIERLRDEKRFDNLAELKKQIAEDVAQGQAILASWSEGET